MSKSQKSAFSALPPIDPARRDSSVDLLFDEPAPIVPDFQPFGAHLRSGTGRVDLRDIPPIHPSDEQLQNISANTFDYDESNTILTAIKNSVAGFDPDALYATSPLEPTSMIQEPLLFLDTEESSQWSDPTPQLLAEIRSTPWKVVDVETTGLTTASKPVNLTNKELRAGDDPTLRLRVVTVTWYHMPAKGVRTEAFDLDQVLRMYGGERVTAVCEAAMTGCLVGHNAGFDLGWLAERTTQRPTLTLDTLLLGRALRPDVPLQAAMIVGERDPNNRHWHYEEIRKIFLNKGKGMWTLGTLSALLLNRPMDKGLQKPKNWTRQVLGVEHFNYATGDTENTLDLLCLLLGCKPSDDILSAYRRAKDKHPELENLEPQIPDVLTMRRNGIPINRETAKAYAKRRFQDAREHARLMAEQEPDLMPYIDQLANPDLGLNDELKLALAAAFLKRGVPVRYTDKAGSPQVGEKDLRLAGAERIESAKTLFKHWVGVSKAQKAGNMALEVAAFSERSPDGRIHPILSHGPATGRLSSSEPNSQQFPGDPLFRAIVEAIKGKKIASSDYSALDVRVGAALCIRTQREIRQRYENRNLSADLLTAVGRAYREPYEALRAELLETEARVKAEIKHALDKRDWALKDILNRELLLARLSRRLAEVMMQAVKLGEPEWSALREAFRLNLDIHTYTAMKMEGHNPADIFNGLASDQIQEIQKKLKEELGDKRKAGKVANLGLLYAMMEAGFADYANKTFNMGWDIAYATEVRAQWLDAYPEVDLWHCWTELNPGGQGIYTDIPHKLWIPEKGKAYNMPREWYAVRTLGGRTMITFGINAALAFPDQGTGADIIGLSLRLLREENPEVFHACINQVHDELVFEIPEVHQEGYASIITEAMGRAGNHFCMPFGVPIQAEALVGDVWLKD